MVRGGKLVVGLGCWLVIKHQDTECVPWNLEMPVYGIGENDSLLTR